MSLKMLYRAVYVIILCSLFGLQNIFAQSDPAGDAVALKSEFDLLKILGLMAIAISVAAGLALFAYRHKRLMRYDALIGLIWAIILAPLLLLSFNSVALSANGSACLSMAVSSGADAQPIDAACGSSRETAANMIGATSLWRTMMGETIVDGMVAPLSAGIVKILMYLSVILGTLILYLLIRPLLKRFI